MNLSNDIADKANMLMRILMIILSLSFSIVASGNEVQFNHIRLASDFVHSIRNRSEMDAKDESKAFLREKISEIIFEKAHTKSISQSQDALIYDNIREYLESRYQGIGEARVSELQRWNRDFNLGQENYSGFSWQKPFGGIGFNIDRQLAPDLFDSNRWIVQDTLTLAIDAATFLGKLKDGGVVDMLDSEIAAFAGIEFKRVLEIQCINPKYILIITNFK